MLLTASKAVRRLFEKAAVRAGTDAELTGEAAEAALFIVLLVSEVTVPDLLLPLADGLALYVFLSQGVLGFFGPFPGMRSLLHRMRSLRSIAGASRVRADCSRWVRSSCAFYALFCFGNASLAHWWTQLGYWLHGKTYLR